MQMEGTPDAAQIHTRLRATGVHRAEFAPAAPLDFDAQCGFVFHFSAQSVEKLNCDSPLGHGHIRLTGELPGEGKERSLTLELDQVPVAAGLDALRTVRSGFGPGLEAQGVVTGKLVYAKKALTEKPEAASGNMRSVKTHAALEGPLTGSLMVEGFELNGDGLSEPIRAAKLELTPTTAGSDGEALTATMGFAAGGAGPLTVSAELGKSGYRLTVRGQASVARARELAKLGGVSGGTVLDDLAGEPVSVDLSAEGPWMAAEKIPFSGAVAAPDKVSGTVTLRNANWKAGFLANAVLIPSATLHLEDGGMRWDPVGFSYGPVKGTASLNLPTHCLEGCVPTFELEFGQLDASALEAAILGAKERVTLISTLLAKLRPEAAPAWPRLNGTVKAETLTLGPVTLQKAVATVEVLENGAHVTGLDANLLGGKVHAAGALYTPKTGQEKPSYMIEAQLEKLNPAAVGLLLNQHWTGTGFLASGKVELTGFTQAELAATAKGTLHFDWRRGAVTGGPAELARFDRWTADAVIGDGSITLKQNQVERGAVKTSLEAAATVGDQPKLKFAGKELAGKR